LQEGGQIAENARKNFTNDFQKLLNVFCFYSATSSASLLVPILTDFISSSWTKEEAMENLVKLVIPPTNANQTDLQLTTFDRALLLLFHEYLRKVTTESPSVVVELTQRILFPKLTSIQNAQFVQFLTVHILSSVSTQPEVYNRVHVLLRQDPWNSEPPLSCFANFALDKFVEMANALQFHISKTALLRIFSRVANSKGVIREDKSRIEIFDQT
jgi:hypothetical protein